MNSPLPHITAPRTPQTLQETGLSQILMCDIVLKTMFRMGIEHVTSLAKTICLPQTLTQELVEILRGQKLLEATGTLHATSSREMGYKLSDAGKARAFDALAQSEYFGPMPVPLAQYRDQVRRQSIRNNRLTRDNLEAAMQHLIVPSTLLDQLGPAVGSGRSILLYGPPGNGKSSIANALRDAMGEQIYVPHALEYSGQTISFFDPLVHTRMFETHSNENALRLGDHARIDSRYTLCRRPAVVTGGELMLSMLDLAYNPVSRTYQAPLQLKASGGIFIVDDLGRQSEPPQDLINRWIVPMEMGYDILSLQSGEKFMVPFDTLVVFSTNFHPNKLFDGAALRRIFFKILINGPDQELFLKIFAMTARRRKMPLDEAAMLYLLKEKYPSINNLYANYHPVFLIDQIIAICDYEGIPYQMSPNLIDRAWENLFVQDTAIAH
ncbi:MAG: ATP-binding protein [Paracoccaceae bacterium]|nr:ATP-binding protein [Paracoccaceae bacterium]MDP5345338.1 ATP-binding protein [Paracoccaceae bacterium]